MRRFSVVYADPPWRFETYSAKGRGRSADNHYPVMTLTDIANYKLPPIASDAALFLWTTDSMLQHAFAVMEAWGFVYKTVAFIWAKTSEDGKAYPIGMGYWTRANPEICLLGTRGAPKRQARDVGKLVIAPRGKHSEKPLIVNRRIESLLRGPYVELFASRKLDGWTCLGNEL